MCLNNLNIVLFLGAILTGLSPVASGKTTREFNYQLTFRANSARAFSGAEFRQAAIQACQEHIETFTDEDPLGIYGDFGVSSVQLDDLSLTVDATKTGSGIVNKGTVQCDFWLDIHSANAKD